MHIFINDCLLQDDLLLRHLNDEDLLFTSLKEMSLFFDVIKEKRLEFNNKAPLKLYVSSEIIEAFFNLISQKDLENLFRAQLSKITPIYWNENSIQKRECQYYLFDSTLCPPTSLLVNNTSLAEAYEFMYVHNESVLALNFPNSILSTQVSLLVIAVKVNSSGSKHIACIDNDNLLKEWIEHNLDRKPFIYDKKSKVPPTDIQTCLRSKLRFEDTGKTYQERKIYRELSTENQWYVDNLHFGEKAHIEVFDNRRNFVGEATIDGVLIVKEINPHSKSASRKKKEKRKLK